MHLEAAVASQPTRNADRRYTMDHILMKTMCKKLGVIFAVVVQSLIYMQGIAKLYNCF